MRSKLFLSKGQDVFELGAVTVLAEFRLLNHLFYYVSVTPHSSLTFSLSHSNMSRYCWLIRKVPSHQSPGLHRTLII
jgi:hypothetical protein